VDNPGEIIHAPPRPRPALVFCRANRYSSAPAGRLPDAVTGPIGQRC